MKRLPPAVLIAACIATSAASHAGTFIKDRQQWVDMSPAAKGAFVAGVNDGLLGIRFLGDAGAKDDLNRCLLEMEVNTDTLVDLVDAGYSDVANWGRAPSGVLFGGARKMCRSRINGYRAERGEEPLRP